MSNIFWKGGLLLFRDPLTLNIVPKSRSPKGLPILFTLQSMNVVYFKYTISGVNVILFNSMPFILFTLILAYVPWPGKISSVLQIPIFFCSLISTIPLAYYIGMAVSSISAQTSFAVGAVLNATFGSLIELLIYFIALWKGLHNVVQEAVTGSLLGTMLLMPGLSMVFGGLKHKDLYFNTHAAGVSSVLLILAIIGALIPSLFYQIYGNYDLDCTACILQQSGGMQCSDCKYIEKDFATDPVYLDKARYDKKYF